MRLLVLGGTAFLSREVARQALARGHEVACACRGVTGTVPGGARHIPLDRAADTDSGSGPWAELAGTAWDAVVDVARTPSWVRTALTALGEHAGHWLFVSTISVYADHSRRAGTVTDTPRLAAADGDLDDTADPTAYGRNKVACEEAVTRARGGRALLARAGLIAGPGDPSGRFTAWPVRLARGRPVLAAEPRDRPVQWIDVRDLAGWLVDAAEQRVSGTYDAVGPAVPLGSALADMAAAVGTDPEIVWAAPQELERHDVRPWAGPRSLPLWLPDELAGMLDRDAAPARSAGLQARPVSETARDTLAWGEATPGARVTGLTAEEEAEVIAAVRRAR